MTEETARLLRSLAIDRGAPAASAPVANGAQRGLVIAAAVVGGVVIGFAAFMLFARGPGPAKDIAAQAAPAQSQTQSQAQSSAPQPQPQPQTAPSGSLSASGYVVARRKATVAAEITGKVVEVFIEEGM